MRNLIYISFLLLLTISVSCRKPYTPPEITTDYSYLVVDGVVNANKAGITTLQLSRTIPLTDSTSETKPETGATVFIEDQSGSSYPVVSVGNGVYTSNALSLNISAKYRLRINDTKGDSYLSDYVAVKQTPPIDSLTWKQDKDLTVFVHTHDPLGNTTYYRWDYVETWQYRSMLEQKLGLDNQNLLFYRDASTQVYNCWQTFISNNIVTATSRNLAQDIISYAPVTTIEQNDQRLFVRYSINVKQYGVTKEAFDYWQILQKSTQKTGSVFDPAPAQVSGNIHCVNKPDKPVIGFVSASYITEKRLFVDHRELVGWNQRAVPDISCETIYTFQHPTDWRIYNFPDTTYGPYYFSSSTIILAKKDCLDCTRKGGTPVKPAFWQ